VIFFQEDAELGSNFHQQAKKIEKILLSLKTVVNVPRVDNKQKNLVIYLFFVCISKAIDDKKRFRIRIECTAQGSGSGTLV
jgi:hypothetical protein